MFELTVRVISLELLQEILAIAVSKGGTVTHASEQGEKLIAPERRISAATSQKIREVQSLLGVSLNGAGKKPRKVAGRIHGATDRTREIFSSGEDFTPVDIQERLTNEKLLGNKTAVSSLLDRLVRQGDVKRVSPGVYRATARLLKTAAVEPTGGQ